VPARLIKIKYITIPAEKVASYCFALLHRRRSTKVNQTLHDAWPSPGLVHYMYIFQGSCPLTEFCQVQNSLCVQVLHFPILAALLHGTQAVGVTCQLNFSAFSRGCHLYLAWQPSSWALLTFQFLFFSRWQILIVILCHSRFILILVVTTDCVVALHCSSRDGAREVP